MVECSLRIQLKRMDTKYLTAKMNYFQYLLFFFVIYTSQVKRKVHYYFRKLIYEINKPVKNSITIAFVLATFPFLTLTLRLKI